MNYKKVSIESGGDWNDASYDLLDIPTAVDLDKEKEKHDLWYKNEYVPHLKTETQIPYLDFTEWLIKNCGAKHDEDVERFSQY